MAALPLGSHLSLDANMDMASRTPRSTPINTIDQLRQNSYEVRAGVRAAPGPSARLIPQAEIGRPGAGRLSQPRLPVKATAYPGPPSTPSLAARKGVTAPAGSASGGATPKMVGGSTPGPSGNVTPKQFTGRGATPTAAGCGNQTPKLTGGATPTPSAAANVNLIPKVFDSPGKPKYVTESELEARLAEHKRHVEDTLRQFCDSFDVYARDLEASRKQEVREQPAEELASTQQLNTRCSKAEAGITKLEEQCFALQRMHQAADIRYEDRQQMTDDLLADHAKSIKELKQLMETVVDAQLQLSIGGNAQGRAVPRMPSQDLPVVHERYTTAEAPAADEAAGSPAQNGGGRTPRVLARATHVSSVSSSTDGLVARLGQSGLNPGARLKVPTGDVSDTRAGINFPSFDEFGAHQFFGQQRVDAQPQQSAPI